MRLNDKSLLRHAALIDGEWLEAGNDCIKVINPSTHEVIGSVPSLGIDEIKKAIKAAEKAQKSWAKVPAKKRSDILRKWYDLIIENVDDLATILTAEQGKPLAEAKGEVVYAASFVEWFAEEARRSYGDIIPGQSEDKRIFVIKQPVGVVAAITPWNFPTSMITRKVAPALAAGCSIVLKPAELTPYSAIAHGILAERAGLPKGLFNIVMGDAPMIGAEMTSSPIVRKISFTGSTRVGSILMAQSAPTVKKMALELGGNAPFIIFDDADIDAAVKGVISAKFRNNGQTCVCANRIYVHGDIYQAFSKKLSNHLAELKVGDGFSDDVTFGPLINEGAISKVEEHIKDAVSKGAKIIAGGKPHKLGGTFFEPTILADVTQDMLIASEETFGPVAPLFKFTTEDEVVEMANDTEFGLASYVFTNDVSRVWRVSEALEYGMVGINTGAISTAQAPFGGIKSSGIGREGSKYGLEDFLELKYICMGGL
ncbi:MAG: succinate-semialdehyde dehydrogenase (NADP(+)) [Hyphomicrobiales bacterium]|nr:NAD-dependent succinate-semialdehyde dehydrogenase [Hyphomicrobiales bacterium]PCH50787.1 MAG: succinate-semialdehyde dehydrogenase (NADP(+)) [Hyphomicrobiales bacterium]